MSSLEITVSGDALSLEALTGQQLQDLRKEAALATSSLLQDHFDGLPGQSFYAQAARSVELNSNADGDYIAISQVGVALQYFGGTVRAGKGVSSKTGKPTSFLAIPARKGMEAPSYYKGQLSFLWNKGKKAARLVDKADKSARPAVFFWLVKQATIKPHPHILPSLEQVDAATREGAINYLSALSFLQS